MILIMLAIGTPFAGAIIVAFEIKAARERRR